MESLHPQWLLVLILTLAGCSSLPEELAETDAAATFFVQAVASGDRQALTVVPDDTVDRFTAEFDTLSASLAGYAVEDAERISWYVEELAPGIQIGRVVLEAAGAQGWVVVYVELINQSDRWQVWAMTVQQSATSQAGANSFRLTGLGPNQYGFLFILVLLGWFTLGTFYRYLRGPKPRRWILWGVFILSGVCALSVNWHTGDPAFNLLEVRLPFFSASRVPAEPWVLKVSLPIGAIMYWVRSDRWADRAPPSERAAPTSVSRAAHEPYATRDDLDLDSTAELAES